LSQRPTQRTIRDILSWYVSFFRNCPYDAHGKIDYTRRDTRRVRKLASSTETILLNSTHTQLVSNSELRIMQLVDQMPEFQHLTNSAWENERVSLSIKANVDASSSRGLGPLQRGNNTINEFEVPWYLLLAISVEPSYLGKTEYNFFQLIRAGNQFSRIDPVSLKPRRFNLDSHYTADF
jgi:hypothetical protein